MNQPVDHVQVEIPCPHCHRANKASIGWLRSHQTLTCSCGMESAIDADRIRIEIQQAEQRFAALLKTVKDVAAPRES